MKKRVISAVLLFVLLVSELLGTATAKAQNVHTKLQQSKNVKGLANWKKGPDGLSSESAIVMELSTGLILYEKKPHKQHYPASITKILTTLLCLENSSLSETVTYSQNAVYGIEIGSSNIGLVAGEELTMEQSLYGIMLESANEACLGVAEHVAGSVDAFVDLMNDRVKSLGLKDTHFMNPNGLHHDKHYTSAYDMAVISREAMKNNTFRKIAGTKTGVIPKTNKNKKRYLANHQELLHTRYYPQYLYEYCIGGKTGYTSVAGATLVTFAKKDGMELVCVTMNGKSGKQGEPNCFTDSIKLLSFTFENYRKYNIDNSEDEEEQEDVLFSSYNALFDKESTPIHLSKGASIVLPKGAKVKDAKKKIKYHSGIEIKEGENEIGTLTYTYKGRNVGSASIIYDNVEAQRLGTNEGDSVSNIIEDLKENEKNKKSEKKITFSFKKLLPSNWKFKGIHIKGIKVSGKMIDIIIKILAIIVIVCLLAVLIRFVYKKKRRRGVQFHRKHNRTWESFNKSLGDFKLDK